MTSSAVRLAEEFAEAGDFEAAACFFRQAIALEPGCAPHYEALAQCLLEMGEPEAAAAEAAEACELAPDWTAPLLTLGRASLNAGRFADAVLSLRAVLDAVAPQDSDASAEVMSGPAVHDAATSASQSSAPLLDAVEVEELRQDLSRAEQLLLQACCGTRSGRHTSACVHAFVPHLPRRGVRS